MKWIASLMIVGLLCVPAMAQTQLFFDDFDYAAGQVLVDGQNDDQPGDGIGGWYSKDGKPNNDPVMTTGSSVTQQGGTGSEGGHPQMLHQFPGVEVAGGGQLLINLDITVTNGAIHSLGNFGRTLGAGSAGGLPDWDNAFLQLSGPSNGQHTWGIRNGTTSGVFSDFVPEEITWEIDLDTMTQNVYRNGTQVATGPYSANVDYINAAGTIEWASWPGVEIDSFEVSYVPEPATMALLGLGGLGALIRRRR